MPRVVKAFLLSILLVFVAMASVPKVGDPAPQFSLPSTKRTNVSLKDYAGKTKVVLVFYRGDW
jgi:peroxiredoxin